MLNIVLFTEEVTPSSLQLQKSILTILDVMLDFLSFHVCRVVGSLGHRSCRVGAQLSTAEYYLNCVTVDNGSQTNAWLNLPHTPSDFSLVLSNEVQVLT
jgi:hypothetical protein